MVLGNLDWMEKGKLIGSETKDLKKKKEVSLLEERYSSEKKKSLPLL